MTNNDILRRLRYALNLSDPRMHELFALAGGTVSPQELDGYFRREDDRDYLPCPGRILDLFLKGLIVDRRGPRDAGPTPPPLPPGQRPTFVNNDILRALRIALELKDDDLVEILSLAQVKMSRSELNALFRKKGHENYRECGDQLLRNFLTGLTAYYRR